MYNHGGFPGVSPFSFRKVTSWDSLKFSETRLYGSTVTDKETQSESLHFTVAKTSAETVLKHFTHVVDLSNPSDKVGEIYHVLTIDVTDVTIVSVIRRSNLGLIRLARIRH